MAEKVTLKPIFPCAIYFPSIDEFAIFLGYGVSARSKSRLFKELLEHQIPISDRSLDNLGKDGISLKLAKRASWPTLRVLYGIGLLAFLKGFPTKMRPTDVIHSWKVWLKGFSLSGAAIDLCCIHAFLEERSTQYDPIREFIDTSPKLTSDNQSELLDTFYKLALPRTLLTPDQQAVVLSIVNSETPEQRGSEVEKECLLKWYYDFHLSLFAVIDLTILSNVTTENTYDNGLIAQIFEQEGKTYFSKLLSQLNMFLGISDRKLSKFIPIDRDVTKECNTSLHEAQINTLKEWRNGSTKPTWKTLNRFYQTIGAGFDYFPMLVLSSLCIALDKKLAEEPMGSFHDAFLATFSVEQYQKYFHYYKKKLPNTAA